jgi:hypothetical protein
MELLGDWLGGIHRRNQGLRREWLLRIPNSRRRALICIDIHMRWRNCLFECVAAAFRLALWIEYGATAK